MVWIFPCKRWGSDGPTCMPSVSFLLLRPPTVKSKMFQDLFERSWFLVFFYSLSLYFLLEILLNSISHFHGITALYKLTFSNTRFSVSPLSAVNLFTNLNILKHRMNWSKPITLTDLPGRNLCRCKKYVQPAGISLLPFGIWRSTPTPTPALTGSLRKHYLIH